ncbi:MAG: diacylglycerol kinase family protein [Muribaculaceae bacterium]|nr:diacylglycerol kinase family protein [Muribaculaceae bacterium]
MIGKTTFSWKKRALSFKYAWQGISALLRYEHNARIHLVAAVVAVVAGFFFKISAMEWCLIAVCIGMVISAEAMNSAVEALADKISKEYDLLIGRAKDFGAAAVMILAFMAVVVGLIIFLPKFIALF